MMQPQIKDCAQSLMVHVAARQVLTSHDVATLLKLRQLSLDERWARNPIYAILSPMETANTSQNACLEQLSKAKMFGALFVV